MADSFVKQGGGNQELGVANLFTQGFYQEFSNLKDNLQPFLLTKSLMKFLDSMTCKQFFSISMDLLHDPELVNTLCEHYDNYGEESFAAEMVDVCMYRHGDAWSKLEELGVGILSLMNNCDIEEENTVGRALQTFRVGLDSLYNCSMTPIPVCSNYELALKQWLHSTVT